MFSEIFFFKIQVSSQSFKFVKTQVSFFINEPSKIFFFSNSHVLFKSVKKNITVNRSPHVFKKSKEHFIYYRSPFILFSLFLFKPGVFLSQVFKQDSYLFENLECRVKTRVRFLKVFYIRGGIFCMCEKGC